MSKLIPTSEVCAILAKHRKRPRMTTTNVFSLARLRGIKPAKRGGPGESAMWRPEHVEAMKTPIKPST